MIKEQIQNIKKKKIKKALHVRLSASILSDFNRICKAEKLSQEELVESFVKAYYNESLTLKEE